MSAIHQCLSGLPRVVVDEAPVMEVEEIGTQRNHLQQGPRRHCAHTAPSTAASELVYKIRLSAE